MVFAGDSNEITDEITDSDKIKIHKQQSAGPNISNAYSYMGFSWEEIENKLWVCFMILAFMRTEIMWRHVPLNLMKSLKS